jgi:peptide/nickel transport system permease protein
VRPLGLTRWSDLCGLVRAETSIRCKLDYVRVAQASSVGHQRVMWRRIFLNVAHLMLIVTVLAFSALAFGFMVSIVLAANLLADGAQRAFDPRA